MERTGTSRPELGADLAEESLGKMLNQNNIEIIFHNS